MILVLLFMWHHQNHHKEIFNDKGVNFHKFGFCGCYLCSKSSVPGCVRGQLLVTRLRSVVMGTQTSKCGTGTTFCHWYQPKGTMGKFLLTPSHRSSTNLQWTFWGQLLLVLMCSGVLHIPEHLSLAQTCLCMSSLHAVCLFWSFNFISVFITSHFWADFFVPLFMFDILLSSFSTSHRCWCVDLSGAEGRLPLAHFLLGHHLI